MYSVCSVGIFRGQNIPVRRLARRRLLTSLPSVFPVRPRPTRSLVCSICFLGLSVLAPGVLPAADDAAINALVEQNKKLLQQVEAQQKQINELRDRLDRIEPSAPAEPSAPSLEGSGRQIRISGETSLGFFHSQDGGLFPNSEFRVDDARLFIEAPIWKNVYFFGGLDLTTREASDENVHVGEFYVDAEQVFSGGRDRYLSIRAGRFNIPFGEEYQHRNALSNPLISHSVADLWGIDEGIQLYGALGQVKYNFAVQNGGHKALRDFDADKSLTVRLAYEPNTKLRFSASAMRTGKLSSAGDLVSELWIGNAVFRPLGPGSKTFAAELLEFDALARWKGGQVLATLGWADYKDDSPAGDFSRRFRYYSLEARQQFTDELFGAIRFSDIRVPGGYVLQGNGYYGRYGVVPGAPLTTQLQRLSVGLGYRFSDPLLWKIEYSWEKGRAWGGIKRDDEDMLSSLLGIKF